MENKEGDLSTEELRLRARCSTLEGLIAHLQEENTNLRINHDDLQARSKALERAWSNVQAQLEASNRTEVPGNELLSSREARDRGFEDWYKRDGVSLPPIGSLGLYGELQKTESVTLPQLRVNSEVAPENAPTPESPVPANSHSVTDQTQSHTVDSSDLSSPRLPSTPLVKHEEDEPQPTSPTPTTNRTRKGVMSSGVRAPKRKNPDDYTDDPPTPFGERRSKRVRVAVNYDEGDFENIGQLAEEAWEEDSESRSTSSESAEETDEDFDDMPPPAPDRPSTPSPKPDGNDTPTSNTKKRRYKKRPTNDRARWAKGTDVQVRFRFEWKPPTVLGLYEEWYQGANGNPSIESLETKYGAKWRNHPEKNYNAYANDWVNKRRRVIKALNYFAEKQGKRPYELAHEWDKVVQGRISQLVDTLPPPTAFERMKNTMVDPLLHFALLPKKKRRRLRRR